MSRVYRPQINEWEDELAEVQDKLFKAEKEVLCNSSVDRYAKDKEINEYKSRREHLRLKIRNFELEKSRQELQETNIILNSSIKDLNSAYLDLKQNNSKLNEDNEQIREYSETLSYEREGLQKTQRNLIYFLTGTLAIIVSLLFFIFRLNKNDSSFRSVPEDPNNAINRVEELKFSVYSSKESFFKVIGINKLCVEKSPLIEYTSISRSRKILTIGRIYFHDVECSINNSIKARGIFIDQSSYLGEQEDWTCTGHVTFDQEKKLLWWTMKSGDEKCPKEDEATLYRFDVGNGVP